jgi:hypothetical protein
MGFRTCSQNIKIFKQIYTSIYMAYNQNMAKFFMDDFEEDYKIEKKNQKIKKIIDVIIIITIYNSFILFLNDIFKFIFKYLNINL